MLLIALPERWSWGQDKKGMAGAPSAVGNVNISAIKKAVIAEKASYAENKIQDPFGFRGKNNLTPFLKQAFCLFIFFIILHCRMLWLLFFSTQSMRHVVIAIYFFDLRDIFFFRKRGIIWVFRWKQKKLGHCSFWFQMKIPKEGMDRYLHCL